MPAVFLLGVLSGFAFSAVAAEPPVGSIKTIQGSALIRRGADTVPIREGVRLLLNDVLETSVDARLGLILDDGTRIALGPNSELRIDQFIYQPVQGKFGLLLRLGRGVLAYISGRIARFSAESVKVETPVGVIGLRGTNFAVSLEGG